MTKVPMVRALLCACGIATALWLLYSSSLTGYFVTDDYALVQVAADLVDRPVGEVAERIFYSNAGEEGTKFVRPLTFLSILGDFAAWGVNAYGYRLTNLILHMANALVLAALVRVLLGSLWPALLAALLFGIHGANPETVAWPAARADLVAGLFILTATVFFARRQQAQGGCAVAAWLVAATTLLALGSKEPAVMLVPTVTMLAFSGWSNGPPRGEAPPDFGARVRAALAQTWWLWLFVVGYFALRLWLLGTLVGGHRVEFAESNPLTLGFWSWRWDTLGALIAPVHLEALSPSWKLGGLTLGFLLPVLGFAAGRSQPESRKLWLFGACWVALTLIPLFQLPVYPVTLYCSHNLYHATAAIAFLWALAVRDLTARSTGRRVVGLLLAAALLGSQLVMVHAHLRYWEEAGRLSRKVQREWELASGIGPLETPAGVLGPITQVFHDREGTVGVAREGGQFAALARIELMLVGSMRKRLRAGDATARSDLAELLLSGDGEVRRRTIEVLEEKFGERRGYDPDAPPDERRRAAAKWR